jgi:hypothetical protein
LLSPDEAVAVTSHRRGDTDIPAEPHCAVAGKSQISNLGSATLKTKSGYSNFPTQDSKTLQLGQKIKCFYSHKILLILSDFYNILFLILDFFLDSEIVFFFW